MTATKAAPRTRAFAGPLREDLQAQAFPLERINLAFDRPHNGRQADTLNDHKELFAG